MKKVLVIGGGAGGMLVSISLKQRLGNGVEVTILEKEDRIGKKILKTGNGKCNVTNDNLSPRFYNDEEFVAPILNKYDVRILKSYLSSLGLLMKSDSEGRVYPISESAASFLDLLKNKVEEYGVKVYVDHEVLEIKPHNNKYRVYTKYNDFEADYVVIASGSKAQIKNYNDSFIRQLGLKVEKERPGLVSVKVKEKIVSLSGIRVKAKVLLTKNGNNVFCSEGEILFKDDYLSGIVIMSTSRHIKDFGNYIIHVDLLKDYEEHQIVDYLGGLNPNLNGEHILIGILPKMLSLYVLKQAGISLNRPLKNLTKNDRLAIAKELKDMKFSVVDVNDYDKAQIVMGGISLDEICNETLELKNYSNIYTIGEVMDIDGECGGFNLSWAWASALNVSEAIMNKEK